jgi:hypothetical protein
LKNGAIVKMFLVEINIHNSYFNKCSQSYTEHLYENLDDAVIFARNSYKTLHHLAPYTVIIINEINENEWVRTVAILYEDDNTGEDIERWEINVTNEQYKKYGLDNIQQYPSIPYFYYEDD